MAFPIALAGPIATPAAQIGKKWFPKDPTLERLNLSAGKTCVVCAGKASVVSAAKTSVESENETSVVCQDISTTLPTRARWGRCCNTVEMSSETSDVLSADTSDDLAAHTLDCLPPDTTHVSPADNPGPLWK